MRRTKLYPLVALLGAAALGGPTSSAHAQGLRDVRAIKPAMMLLVDTSGSMERMPDVGTQVDKLPTCTNTADDAAQKSRWAVTLEALTGSFSEVRCVKRDRSTYVGEFDEGYFLPHYDFTTHSKQRTDGVLDSFKNRLKFGLMTFDGVMTTVEGNTLVEYDQYSQSAIKSQVLGRQGMYSYPDTTEDGGGHGWMRLFFPGCTTYYGVNAGARGEGVEAGSLIPVSASDKTDDVERVNARIQASLLEVRPYGGTPIAGMLDDLRYYLKNDEGVKKNSDPYYECRRRFAILLTDGAPDAMFRDDRFNCAAVVEGACTGDDCCPYDTEVEIAKKLVGRDRLEKLWVVAFNLNDSAGMETLNKISQAGSNRDALNAQTPNELRDALTSLMNLAAPGSTSRSVPVVVNTGKPVLLGGKQFEVLAGFKVGATDDEPWQGTLLRRRVTCEDTTPKAQDFDPNEGDMFHVTLNKQSSENGRTLRTIHPKPVVAGSVATSSMFGNLYGVDSNAIDATAFSGTTLNTVRPDGTAFTAFSTSETPSAQQTNVDNDVVLTDFGQDTPPIYFGDANRDKVDGQAADRDAINLYLRGRSDNRIGRTLGDIYHSNPVVLPPLFLGSEHLNSFDPNLRKYYADLLDTNARYGAAGRPGVVFVGTNDGLLHAFNLDHWVSKNGTARAPGYEFWSFVPPALFDKLDVAPSHTTMFDGTPVVRDVVYTRDPTSPSTPPMGTVLLAAIRGAPAYMALDVTHPEEPKFLWQRSFGFLGNTVATPAIGHVKISWNGTSRIRAVAILQGGEGVLDTSSSSCAVNEYSRGKATGGRDHVRCWKQTGRSLYVVDVATGELLQEFDSRHFPSPITGAMAVDSEGLSVTKAAYFTDEDGVLWRLSMLNANPSQWRVQPIWDLFAGDGTNFAGTLVTVPSPTSSGRPAIYPPLLVRDAKTANYTILVGTGDVDNLTDSIPHRVVSLKETRKVDTSGELAGTIEKNWVLQLETGEAVTGPLVAYDDTLYFATFQGPAAGTDACEMGTSRIVGADVRNAAGGLPKPKLVQSDGTVVLSYFPEDATNSLLLGLSIARDPVCMVGLRDPNAGTTERYQQTGGAGGGTYTLRSMVAGQEGYNAKTQMKDTDLRQLTRTLPIPNIARSVGWASSVE